MAQRLLILLALVTLLAACAEDPDQTAPKPTSAPTDTPSPQTLLIWHPYDDPEQATLQQIVTDFVAQNPRVTVTLERVDQDELLGQFEAAVQSGMGPDLIFGPLTWIPVLAEQGLLQPIYTDIQRKLTDLLPESLLRATAYADSDYGMPFAAEFTTLYTNTALVSTPPSVFEDFATGTGSIVADANFFTLSGLYFDAGNQLLDANGSLLVNAAGLETVLIQMQTLAPSFSFATDYTAFMNGEKPFLLASSNAYQELKAALGDQLAVATLPRIAGSEWRTLIIPQIAMQSVNITANSREAADLLFAFLLSADEQRIWFENTGRAPVNTTGIDELREAWGHTLRFGISVPMFEAYESRIRPALDQAIQAVLVDGQEPSAAAADAQIEE